MAPGSGFLVGVDAAALLRTCVDLDVVVVLETHVGSSVVEGTPLGSAWALTDAAPGEDLRDRLQRSLGDVIRLGIERTAVQDIGYGLRQLTDVANKALSPGINDPTTAVHSLGHISAILAELTRYELGPGLLADDQHRTRVVIHRPDLADLVDLAITQPRRYGATDPFVMHRLFTLLRDLGWHCRPHQHHVVDTQLERLVATVRAQDFDPVELAQLELAAASVRTATTGQ
jgi:uncharacterized membrane protein